MNELSTRALTPDSDASQDGPDSAPSPQPPRQDEAQVDNPGEHNSLDASQPYQRTQYSLNPALTGSPQTTEDTKHNPADKQALHPQIQSPFSNGHKHLPPRVSMARLPPQLQARRRRDPPISRPPIRQAHENLHRQHDPPAHGHPQAINRRNVSLAAAQACTS